MSEHILFRLAGGSNPLILVPVCVEGKGPFQFILDTGASHSLLSEQLSATLGIRPEGERQAMGAGGPVKMTLARVTSVSVGSTARQNIRVGITKEIERVASVVQTQIDGDLGYDFLKDFVLTIDYRDCLLRLGPPTEVVNSPAPATLVPFQLAAAAKPLILVPAMVNGQGPFSFALDTGASRTMISGELARTLHIPIVEEGSATGGGGQVKMAAGKLNSLAVGHTTVYDHGIGVGEFLTMLSQAVGNKLDGILGFNFLRQFRVTIDYPGSRLALGSAGAEMAA
jgi:predicted aspartyl protease